MPDRLSAAASTEDAAFSLVCRHHAGLAGPAGARPFALPGDTPHQAPDRVVDVHNIRIDVAFDIDEGRVLGTCTTTVSAINEGLETLPLDAVEMTIEAVSIDGEPVAFGYDGQELRVHYGARPAGQQVDVAVRYQCTPRRGLYFNRPDAGYPDKRVEIWTQGQDQDSRHWFPCHDFPNEKTTSEVIATVPERFTTLSNGRLLSVEPAGEGLRRWHWQQATPHVYYLVTFVAGEFSVMETDVDGLPVQYLVPPGREADGDRALGNTPAMVRLFNEKIGVPYPWDKYAQVTVQDFIFGGMENTSATTLTDGCLYDERAGLDFTADDLVSHELAHQWFGDLLTCNEWAHGWLNEGFATYFEAIWTEHHRGRDEFHWEMLTNAEFYMGEDASHYRRPLVEKTYNEPIDLFDRHLYEKGSLVLHQLRAILGDDLWWKAIRHYVTKHAYQTVVTSDLQRAIFEATGRNLEWFFDQWCFKGGHPEFRTTWSWDDQAKVGRLTIAQTQETDEVTPLFRVPLTVDFYRDGGEAVRRRIEVSGKEEAFAIPLDFRPIAVVVDPDAQVLCTAEFERPREMLQAILAHCPTIKPQIHAVEGLARQGSGPALATVREVLLDEGRFWGVRAKAAAALGKARGDRAREILLEALDVAHPKVRRAVAGALGSFRLDPVVGATLAERLAAGDASYFVESSTAAALGATRVPEAGAALVGVLDRPAFREVIRAGALGGLAATQDQAHLPVLVEWTGWGKPSWAREAATAALGRLGKKDGQVRDEAIERLVDLLHDPWLRVRLQAVGALQRLGDRRAIEPLQDFVKRELDGRGVRMGREAINAIRSGKQDEEVTTLRKEVDDLVKQNWGLQERLEKLEARLDGPAPDAPEAATAVETAAAKGKAKGKAAPGAPAPVKAGKAAPKPKPGKK